MATEKFYEVWINSPSDGYEWRRIPGAFFGLTWALSLAVGFMESSYHVSIEEWDAGRNCFLREVLSSSRRFS